MDTIANTRKASWRAAAATLAWLALACGCSRTASAPQDPASAKPVAGGSLSWGVESEPATLNPQLNTQAKVYLLLRNTYEGLLARSADGGFVPWLASAWEVSDDGLDYTFHLRPDVKFSDGSALDAATVARNFQALEDPAYTAGTPYPVFARLIERIETPDPHTLRLTIAHPYASFLGFAANLPLLAASAFDKPDLKAGGPDIAGTGPFVLKRYQPGQQVEFERNPDYRWAPANAGHQGPAYLDRVVYRFLPESSVRIGALLSGQVDVIEGVPGQDAAALQANPDFGYQRALNTGTPYTLYFNVERAPTDDARVRQALVEGLDIDTLVQSIYRGQRTRAWGITSPVDPLYDAGIEHGYGNHPEQANALLDQAGWSARDAQGLRVRDGNRLSIELLDSTVLLRDQRDVLLLAIQAQARQRLGIDIHFQQLDRGSYFQHVLSGDYGVLANSSVDVDGRAIEIHYLPPDVGGFLNLNRVQAPPLRQALLAAAASRDPAERKRLYGQVQQFALRQDYLALPLYVPEDQIVARRQVHGLGFRAFYQIPENAYDVWIAR
ncbi:MAG: ABC transporter substrate-binding protein [Pseudoxanthomonas sp.]